MNSDFSEFQDFARIRLKIPAFQTCPNDPKSNLFDISAESARIQFSWTQKSTNQAGEPFRLGVGFIDDLKPNALADYHADQHFIAMHSSLFVAINEFAMFCFAQRDFFADVGDPSIEISPKPWDDRVPGIWLLDHTIRGGHVDDDHSRALIPRDPYRFEISQYLAFLMARFVWLHELAHCYNGHIGYVQKFNLALRLYEVSDPINALEFSKPNPDFSKNDISETLKCLEFDADSSAFWASCNIQLGAFENIEGIMRLDQELRVRLTLFGSYAMVWLFEQFQTYMNSRQNISHPEPTMRLQNLFRTASSRILPLSNEMKTSHENALQQFAAVKSAIPTLYDKSGLEDQIVSETGIKELSYFDARLEALKSDLKPFEYSE